ncbi:MAG: hypothetical protein ACI4CZ_11020 [Hominisplanchenecus sp.]
MAIIKQYHKDTDTTYVYESISYWDPEKGQSRSKRTLLGKIDPETGEVVPTGKRGRSKKVQAPVSDTDVSLQETLARNSELERTVKKQKVLIDELERKNRKLSSALSDLSSTLDKCAALCRSFQK